VTSPDVDPWAGLAAAPELTPPAEPRHRWLATLAALPPPVSADRGYSTAPHSQGLRRADGRRRVGVWLAGAAAVLAVAVVPAVGPGGHRVVGPPPGQAAAQGGSGRALGGADGGAALADPVRRSGCLARVGLGAAPVLAVRRVTRPSGAAAVLLVLGGGVPGEVRTVLVTPDCGPDSGEVLRVR
jgi:hypothetical protein